MDSTDDHGLLDPLLRSDDTTGRVTAGQVRVLCHALAKARLGALLCLRLPYY